MFGGWYWLNIKFKWPIYPPKVAMFTYNQLEQLWFCSSFSPLIGRIIVHNGRLRGTLSSENIGPFRAGSWFHHRWTSCLVGGSNQTQTYINIRYGFCMVLLWIIANFRWIIFSDYFHHVPGHQAPGQRGFLHDFLRSGKSTKIDMFNLRTVNHHFWILLV